MANAESLHRHFYGEMKLPRTIRTVRHGYGPKRVNWIFHFSFNWWSLEIRAWHRWLGGFAVAYQYPRWMPHWAKYGVLNGFCIFKPFPSIPDGAKIPYLCRYEHWSDIVLDKDLA